MAPPSSPSSSSAPAPATRVLRVAALPARRPYRFALDFPPEEIARLKDRLELSGLRKPSFRGEIESEGASGWRLTARLGATVVQPCSVTLAPVTTRIDEDVSRRFVPHMPRIDTDAEEMPMPEDDSLEPLGDSIDLGAVFLEALSLAVPAFPRAEGAEMAAQSFSPPGAAPLDEADLKPFAGLKALKGKLSGTEEE